jgi:diguanylate cyclase (GGDEF)-like protein
MQLSFSALPAEPGSAYAARARADTLALLFHQSYPAVFLSFGIAAVMCWTLWGRIETTALLGWLAALLASGMVRLAMFLRYFRVKPDAEAILAWERPYVATLMLSSLTWGLGAVWLMPAGAAVEQGVVLFFLVGMAGGALGTYSAHRAITIGALLSVLLPCTVWLFFQPGRIALGMALAGAIFIVGASRATKVLALAMQSRLQMGYELKDAHTHAENLARIDALTGIHNRRAFIELGTQTLHLCQRDARPVSALLIDIDHFKQINDRHGHSAGDAVLTHVAGLLAAQFRKSDVCGRIGGEEFAVLLAGSDSQAAAVAAEKFRLSVADAAIVWRTETLRATVSIGIAADGHDLEALLHQADLAMYQAKAAGRNRIFAPVPVPAVP